MKNIYYAYAHLTSDGRVFYIGKGKGRRAWATYGRSEHWKRTVEKYGIQVQIVIDGLSEDEAFNAERELIASMRSTGKKLCNATDGGEGISGFEFSPELRSRISASRTGVNCGVNHHYYGKQRLPDVRKKISINLTGRMIGDKNPMYGKRHTAESLEKMSLARTGKAADASHCRARSVVCVETGVRFETIKAALAWLRGIGCEKADVSALSRACAGKLKSAYGYRWKYFD